MFISLTMLNRDWADDDLDEGTTTLPAPVTTILPGGIKQTVSFRYNDAGQKIKVTRKTKTVVHKEKVGLSHFNPWVISRAKAQSFR
jgi:hypothetical protein